MPVRARLAGLALLVLGAVVMPPPNAVAGVSVATSETAADLPRFAALAGETVNMRVGPGERYPIAWVYQRRGLPVLVDARHGNWRRVRDWQDETGWIHQAMLSPRRTVQVVAPYADLRRNPDRDAALVAQLLGGVVADLVGCQEGWCQVTRGGHTGWLPAEAVWGADRPP